LEIPADTQIGGNQEVCLKTLTQLFCNHQYYPVHVTAFSSGGSRCVGDDVCHWLPPSPWFSGG